MDKSSVPAKTENEKSGRGGKYLTFLLGDESYGLDIAKVREIIGLTDITRVPGTPDFVRGVMNLRGKVIAVVDLGARFGLGITKDSEHTCIIVVDYFSDDRSTLVGMVVDTVSEVLDIPEEIIEDTPVFGSVDQTKFILGLARTECGVRILLDIDKVLAPEDFSATCGGAGNAEAQEGVTK